MFLVVVQRISDFLTSINISEIKSKTTTISYYIHKQRFNIHNQTWDPLVLSEIQQVSDRKRLVDIEEVGVLVEQLG